MREFGRATGALSSICYYRFRRESGLGWSLFSFGKVQGRVMRMTSRAYKTVLACGIPTIIGLVGGGTALAQQAVDFAGATVVIRTGQLPKAEQTAARVLVEELAKRTGRRLPISTTWPQQGIAVVLTSSSADAVGGHTVPKRNGGDRPETRPEGYRIFVEGGKIV